jgi:hypothetical protein
MTTAVLRYKISVLTTILKTFYLYPDLGFLVSKYCRFFLFLGWSGTEYTFADANTGLLYQPRMMIVEQSVGCLAGETEVLGEKQPQCHHKCHMT